MSRKHKVIVVPHTHWDRAWCSPFQQFRMRLVKLVDNLINILNTDPGYKSFVFDGQAVVLEDYLEIHPEVERELKRLIEKGRILVGPWYTLPDQFLVSAESLVRNLMVGHMVAEGFGKVMKVGYVPDCFGHISQLPQILRGFDIDSAIFMRGLGDEGEILGSEFLWYAPDGKTNVLAVHQIGGYCNAVNLGYVQGEIDFDSAVDKCQNLFEMMNTSARTSCLLFNNGSDLVEPQPELTDIVEYVNDKLNNIRLTIGTFTDYLDMVRAEEPKLKKYQNELRGSRYHVLLSGVFSTRMYMRQANEASQTLMERWAEPFSALSWLEAGSEYPRAFLRYAWKELLKNHPHDDVCGCSADEVHRDDMIRYGWVQQVGEELTQTALESLARSIDTKLKTQDDEQENDISEDESNTENSAPAFVVFNPLAWPRSDPVSMEMPVCSIPENFAIINTADGEIVPSQFTRKDDGLMEVTLRGRVPALGYASYSVTSGKAGSEEARIKPRTMENEFFRIKVNRNGSLNILDKSNGTEYKGCNVYEDTEDAGDEYDYSPIKHSRTVNSRGAKADFKVIENGPVRIIAEIRFSMNLPKGLTRDRTSRTSATFSCPITTRVTIYNDTPRIDLSTTFENKVEDHRLRAIFPTEIKTDSVYVEGHFDVFTRPVKLHKPKAEWAQEPVPTNHQNGFVGVEDGDKGFALINKGLPEYEVRETKKGCVIYLTLLRCVGWLSRDDLLTRRGNAGVSIPTPEAQCPGTHTFLYSIYPYSGNWLSAQVQRRTHEHNVPMRAVITDQHEGTLPPVQSFVSVEPHNLMVTALKKCELGDGIILRFYNSTDEKVNGVVRAHKPIKNACLTNLSERLLEDGELNVKSDGSISLKVGKHEIKTVQLTF